MLDIQPCSLVIVDVPGRLAQLMNHRNALFNNIRILITAAKILKIPIVTLFELLKTVEYTQFLKII